MDDVTFVFVSFGLAFILFFSFTVALVFVVFGEADFLAGLAVPAFFAVAAFLAVTFFTAGFLAAGFATAFFLTGAFFTAAFLAAGFALDFFATAFTGFFAAIIRYILPD
ncbi:MAG: hypothetical protein KIS71_01740 [Bacteroidetes bacterium]|nr:hypothetical protein [Bacteroidota bacterium]